MSELIIRYATSEDLEQFYGERPSMTHRAKVALLDGKPIALAGVAYEGGVPKLISQLRPEARRYTKTMIREGIKVLAEFGTPGMLAVADPEEPGSVRLLTRLGFTFVGSTAQGNVFRYGG